MDGHHPSPYNPETDIGPPFPRPLHNPPKTYTENGRHYGNFRKGKYLFPVDEAELDRLDIFHKFFLVARDDAYFGAPLQNREAPRIMDVGCGTGIWTIDVAEKFPLGRFVGLDLNLIQPEYIPPNLTFAQRDIEVPWPDHEPGTWDLIYMRMLLGSISDWSKLYQEAYRHLKPHYGYIEQVEIDFTPRCDDGTMHPESPLVQWGKQLMEAMDGFGRSMRMDTNLTKQRLAEAGFIDIKVEETKFGLNGWHQEPKARDLGRWFNLGFTQGLQALTLAPFHRGFGMSVEEINARLVDVQSEIRSLKVHAYFTLHIFTARKP